MYSENETKLLLSRMCRTVAVGTPAKAKLDRQLTPILADLLKLGPSTRNNGHPAIKYLFNWLVGPQRSAEDFIYVIGPLYQHVAGITGQHFEQYQDNTRYSGYLGRVAVEALAVKCPILEGPWEIVAWLLVMAFSPYNKYDYGFASEVLTVWLIHVIGNPDLCPNPHLRIKLMVVFHLMVDLKDHNRTQAFESFFSACSSLRLDYLLEDGNFRQLALDDITQSLYLLIDYDEVGNNEDAIMKFDEKLSEKLLHLKSSRLSAIFHDISYHRAVNTTRYAQPNALHGLTVLINTISEFAQLVHKRLHNEPSLSPIIEEIIALMYSLIYNFRTSCHSPQLFELTSSCLKNVMELIMSAYIVDPVMYKKNFEEGLDEIDYICQKFYDDGDDDGYDYNEDDENDGDNDDGDENDDSDNDDGDNDEGDNDDGDNDGDIDCLPMNLCSLSPAIL